MSHVLKYENNPLKCGLDMFFVSETCLGHGNYPVFKDFTTISDPTITACQHGGFAWYVKDSLCGHLVGLSYGSSFIAFSLDIFPHVVFVGTYIKPENSAHFDPVMFTDLASFIMDCHERNKVVFIGGDFNSRPGDLNNIRLDNNWRYEENIDKNNNSHGQTFFKDFCTTADVMPLNHLRYKNRKFCGDYTYEKAGKNIVR